jgi:hypothetical protein
MDEHSFNGAIHLKLDALGWDRDAYHAFHDPSRRWFRFHRFGGSYQCSAGHAFDDYWKRFHAEHPDWFAQQPDGSRDNSQPDRGYPSHRLCISNPGLIRQVAADCIDRLKRRPTTDAVSVTPNDGGTQTFCLCPRCESWDAPEAPIVQMRSRNGRIPHVSLSDRFVRFYSAVAEIVAKELPERNIGALAYSLYHLPPVHAKLHPNVVLGFVPGTKIYVDDAAREEMRDTWLHWSRAADKLFVRPNFLLALHALPTVFVHRLGEDMRFFADNKLFFVGIDCNCHHWATNGLNYYVLTKLMWDPYRDVDAIVDEYCTTGFGPASKAVRGYFDAVEKLTHAIAAERKRPGSQVVARHYTDAALADLGKHLDEARRAAGVDQTILARIAFLRQGLDYAPISRDYMVAKDAAEDGDKWQWRSYTEQTVRRASWFQQLGPSHAIHVPWLIYWDW